MTQLSIGNATDVYSNASRCEITRHWVDHPELAKLSQGIRALSQSLGSDAEDEFWQRTLGPVRKLAFAFCSVPLPFAHITSAIATDWTRLHNQVRLCKQLYPDSCTAIEGLVSRLHQLSTERESPLIPPVEEIVGGGTKAFVMLRNPRMNQVAASYFASNSRLQSVKAISPTQLRGGRVYELLAAIGPCSWFPEYVFSAPRAEVIHVISYRWIRDGWKPGPVFLDSSEAEKTTGQNHGLGKMPRFVGDPSSQSPTPADIAPAELLPPIPIFIYGAVLSGNSQIGSTEDTVTVRLCHLCGNRAAFVAAEDGATSLIIDTSETGRASVRRAPTEELETGFYLLLRTSGGGDFIAPLADRILGDLATIRRAQQVEWKQKLILKGCERFGVVSRRELATRIASELRTRQLSQAKPANIHYWMSAKCISPRKRDDFSAIMTFAGLKESAPEFWAAMEQIDRAHKRAGFLIRRMLLRKIAETSLEPLERDGEMTFDLGDQDGGALSAFRITAIQDGIFEVTADKIGVLLEAEE